MKLFNEFSNPQDCEKPYNNYYKIIKYFQKKYIYILRNSFFTQEFAQPIPLVTV